MFPCSSSSSSSSWAMRASSLLFSSISADLQHKPAVTEAFAPAGVAQRHAVGSERVVLSGRAVGDFILQLVALLLRVASASFGRCQVLQKHAHSCSLLKMINDLFLLHSVCIYIIINYH